MVAMASLRARLVVLWLMFAASGAATAFLLLEYYQQSANAQVGRAEEVVLRACREIGETTKCQTTNPRPVSS
jgi:hypothetical protein